MNLPVETDFFLRYQNLRSLLLDYHPQLHSLLPSRWPGMPEWTAAPEADAYQPVSLEEIGGARSRNPRYAVVFGMGSGEWLLNFYEKNGNSLKYFFVLEPDETHFARLLGCHSWNSMLMDTRVCWVVGTNLQEFKKSLLKHSVEIGAWGIHAWMHRLCAERHSETYAFFLDSIGIGQRAAKENTQILLQHGALIQCNILRNLPCILRSCEPRVSENAFPGVPAVIIGAGPSLSRNLEVLCHAPSGVLLIATDTAFRLLLQKGIQPHFVVSCDPSALNDRHFVGIPSLGNAVFAYLPDVNAHILQRFVRHERLLCLHDYQSQLLHALAGPMGWRGKFQRRTNVGLCAFMLARAMGCSPLILMGMDLAVTPGGLSHAEGTANASTVESQDGGRNIRLRGNVESEAMRLMTVPGYWGDTVYTFPHFFHSLWSFEQTIGETGVPVIDATEGGARKKGTLLLSLQEALSRNPGGAALWDDLNRFGLQQPVPWSFVKKFLVEKEIGLRSLQRQLEIGIHRLDVWWKSLHEPVPREILQEQVQVFLRHWNEILHHPDADVGMDIGLAKWRFATWRAEPPEDLSPNELAFWWHEQMYDWFEGLRQNLKLFADLYALILQPVQTVLTSGEEKQ